MASAEQFRPQYHFSPAANWINDPNGLVYYADEYHLFFQYHPHSTVWGPMHWGHAVSPDLIHWEELPIALYPDDLGQIFSGSAVIDWHNTAGFGAEAMVAIFTHHLPEGPHQHREQRQSIAYSLDRGRTWTTYAGNPVLSAPDNTPDFRDPKVFWYGPADTGHWVMSLAVGKAIHFYTSPNLIDWSASGRFGIDQGATGGVWETPDLFELPVAGADQRRWVLLVGVGDGAPAGGSGQQYFVGQFDGQTFTNDNVKSTVLWADYGADAYAMQSWNDVEDGRRLGIAWMNNWVYGRTIPTNSWRGAMTLPRELSLVDTADGLRLRQVPVREVARLRRDSQPRQAFTLAAGAPVVAAQEAAAALELVLEVDCADARTGFCGIRLDFAGDAQVEIGYDGAEGRLLLDRTRSGVIDFDPTFAAVHTAPLTLTNGRLQLHLFLDHSSLELFANDGDLVMTELIFPPRGPVRIELWTEGGPTRVVTVEVHRLASTRI